MKIRGNRKWLKHFFGALSFAVLMLLNVAEANATSVIEDFYNELSANDNSFDLIVDQEATSISKDSDVYEAVALDALKAPDPLKAPNPLKALNPLKAPKNTKVLAEITNADFRRSENGGGKLIVDLSEANFEVDVREGHGEIIVDFYDASITGLQNSHLDVVDFDTPVQAVDFFQNLSNVRLVVVSKGAYEHAVNQAGNRFTLVVTPRIKAEPAQTVKVNGELNFKGERLSIHFQKVEIRSALDVLADFTGINFVTSDSVKGDITINLKDVPWDQALDVILRSKGLSKRHSGNVIWIAPNDEIQLSERKTLEANSATEVYEPLVTQVLQINYAKAADISEVIKSVKVIKQGQVSSSSIETGLNVTETDRNSLLSGRGSVTVDDRTNSLLVQDVARKIEDLRRVIAKLDQPVRQVLIETKIVEANDNFSRELGARLGFQRITNNARLFGSKSSGVGDVISGGSVQGNSSIINSLADQIGNPQAPLVFDRSTGSPGGLAVDLGASSIAGTNPASYAFDIFRAGAGYTNLITLELSALESDGRGRIVSSPRLITSNQKEARISQGQEVFIAVPGGTGGAGALKKIAAELVLVVTPQITPDNRVIMDVEITQDNIISVGAGASVIGTKQIKTQILADNGETVVVGGIYQEQSSGGETKVPLLGDVPILGHFFKKKSRKSNRKELLIFLTPKIIVPKLNLE